MRFIEKPSPAEAISHWVNAGIYVLEPEALDLVPRDRYYDMTELIPRLLEHGRGVSVYPIEDYWLDIGRMGDLERAECDFGELFK